MIDYYAVNATPQLKKTAMCMNWDERNEYQRENLETICEKVNEVSKNEPIIVEYCVWVKNEPGITVKLQDPVWTYACRMCEE